ncbi:Arm DNA-binding domain-containing protein [Lactiplantibacillus plantarum]|uniref:Arm DNA-binding domain-containing protein n=1 Tax=Lactiplantibacillus plantarum TaxID=1590 RepID=A0AAX1K7P0_LACPN|nr:hypothetical protein [Lactiplantibacillus plantarum]MBG1239394.1 hypothetical protein [Lactiplantibacillus plantarum subsp. plantarum]MBE1725176.1 Arm DNA-binding domain-containing protein [Lactiplantibacillus plantarum]MBO2710846.1 hypothetical protein [Lactiplantibacillus plantarum]MBS0955823.1 Arm DNA-binding domain-containing protein [Lactiplantibacillus plantarum]
MAYQGMDTGTGKQKQVHRQGFKPSEQPKMLLS